MCFFPFTPTTHKHIHTHTHTHTNTTQNSLSPHIRAFRCLSPSEETAAHKSRIVDFLSSSGAELASPDTWHFTFSHLKAEGSPTVRKEPSDKGGMWELPPPAPFPCSSILGRGPDGEERIAPSALGPVPSPQPLSFAPLMELPGTKSEGK